MSLSELHSKYLSLYLASREGSPQEDALGAIVRAFELAGEDAIRWIRLSCRDTRYNIATCPIGDVQRLSAELRVYTDFLDEAEELVYAA